MAVRRGRVPGWVVHRADRPGAGVRPGWLGGAGTRSPAGPGTRTGRWPRSGAEHAVSWRATNRWARADRRRTGSVDLAGPPGLLGQTLGRRTVDVTAWPDERGEDFKASITHVATDPPAAYAKGRTDRAAGRGPGGRPLPPHPARRHHGHRRPPRPHPSVARARGREVDPERINHRRPLTTPGATLPQRVREDVERGAWTPTRARPSPRTPPRKSRATRSRRAAPTGP